MKLNVVRGKEKIGVGFMAPQIGMKTNQGKIARILPKSLQIVSNETGQSKFIRRAYDRLPSVTESEAKKWGFKNEN